MAEPPAEHDEAPEIVTRPDHHGSGVDHPVEQTKPKRPIRKLLLRSVIVLVLLAVLLIVLTPTLLSTGPGTRWLVSFINNRTPGELAVDDLQLSWLGGQRATGIRYDDPGQGLQASIASLDAGDVGLFDLLTGSRRLGQVALQDTDLVFTPVVLTTPAPAEQLPKELTDQEPFGLPPNLSGTLTITDLKATYQAADSEPIQLTIDQDEIKVTDLRDIAFELNSVVRQGVKQGRVVLKGDVLNLFDPDGFVQASEAAYDITFDVQDVPVDAVDRVVSGTGKARPGLILALLGNGDLEGKASVNGTIDQLRSKLTIEAPKLHIDLDQRTEDGTLIASPESYAELDLDGVGFKALFPNSGLALHKPTQIDLASLEMALPITDKAVDWDKATASLLLKAGDNLAVVDERGEVLGINDLKIAGRSESIADKLSFKLTTELSAVTRESEVTNEPVVVDLIIREPLESTRQIDFFSEDLPIQLADALAGQDGRLVLWLGKTLDLQADVHGKFAADHKQDIQRLVQHYTLRPDGQITGTISGTYRRGRFTLTTPVNEPVEATLSPEAFASVMEMLSGKPGEPALTIDKPMPVFLTLRDPNRGPVSITTRRGKSGLKGFYPDPDQTYLGATIELSPARVYDPKLKKTYELRGGMLSLSAPDLRGKTDIRAELDLWVRPDAGQQGVASLLTWQTTVTDLLDTEGSVPLDGAALMQQVAASGGMKLEDAPSGLFDSLLNRDGDLASILGPIVRQMDAGFTYEDGQPTGATVRLNWDEKNNKPIDGAWASMKPAAFDIDGQQMLTVRGGEDLELEVRVSEDFGNRWMGKLHPILFDAKSGDRPVKIKVDGKSFRFPLKGEGMQGSRVEASVDLGTIEFGDGALLGKLMEWTNRPGERAIFEPARVSLVDGNISYGELDLAVGKVKLRLDGEVDLASGQIVDMAVRVPGDSLIRVFNELDGVIAKDDYLSIPMTGAIRKPTFDSKLIGKEVARLVTRGLLDKQKDNLKDLIRKGVDGDDKPGPEGNGGPPDDDGEQTPKSVEEELLEGALDLLFKRLGKDKDQAEND
ncbi:MAG: hypothetical protein KTR15_02520 [Phycisphaeraceae bacterium]|nr:hypothetical protein [Phycisphaeraceae bacterium]